MSDETTTVGALVSAVRNFVKERNWEQFHDPKNLSMCICIESAELMELFQWLSPQEVETKLSTPQEKDRIEQELADILIYCLSLAASLGTDISSAVMHKLKENATKYPVEFFRGKHGREITI